MEQPLPRAVLVLAVDFFGPAFRQAADFFGPESSKQAMEAVRTGFYVNDLLISVSLVEEAKTLATDVTNMLVKAGFTFTKWISTEEDSLADIPEDQRSKSIQELPGNDEVKEKVLGVEWDFRQDKFQVNVDILPRPMTRRGILSMVRSLFDPLGFLAPITIEPKLLMKRLNDYDWDVPICAEEVAC